MDDELMKLAIGAAGAVIGYLLKDFLDRRRDAESRRITDRREHYRNLILAVKSIASGSREHIDLVQFEHAFLWLYAPDAVVRSANRLARLLRDESATCESVVKLAGKLVLEMRRDLGFKSTALSASDFPVESVLAEPTDSQRP